MIAMHKRVQEKIIAELRGVFSSVEDPVTSSTLTQLPYMKMVIKESMRLFPIAPITVRKATHEFELNGYTMPIGAHFIIASYLLHRDKSIWGENADGFVPERWETEQIKEIHPFAYLPFSGGPRNCVGAKYAMMLLMSSLSTFLRNFEIETPLKFDELTCQLTATMRFAQPYLISLKPRNF